jgi:hypothetical protein
MIRRPIRIAWVIIEGYVRKANAVALYPRILLYFSPKTRVFAVKYNRLLGSGPEGLVKKFSL